MSQIKYFTNDRFLILNYLYDKKNHENVVSITQKEIAEDLNISRATVNKVINKLKHDGYLQRSCLHIGRYILCEHSIILVQIFRSANNI